MMNKMFGFSLANVLATILVLCAPAQSLAQSDPCIEPRGERVAKGSVGGAIIGGILGGLIDGRKGLLIGAGAGAGTGAAASIRKPAACRGQKVNAAKERIDSKNPADFNPSPDAPSLEGKLVAICFRHGDLCGQGQTGVEELIDAAAVHMFSRMGARILRGPSGSLRTNLCETRRLVICVQYGTPVPYGDTSNNFNNYSNFPNVSNSNGGSEQNQRYAVIVTADLYDNTALDENGRVDSRVTALANTTGIGTAGNGSRFLNTGINGRSWGTSSGSYAAAYTPQQLAQFDASRAATERLVEGRGWLPNAADDLQ